VVDPRAHELQDAAEHIDAEFGAARIEHGVEKLERRLARRRALRTGLGVASAAVLLLGVVFLARGPGRLDWLVRSDAFAPARVADSARLETKDGSEARGIGQETTLKLERDAPDEVALRVLRGKGHFAVKPNKKRRYHVRAGDVQVEVLGTAFTVEVLPARGTQVQVEHGVVKVAWPGGSTTLRAGEHGVFPPPVQAEAAPIPTPEAEESEPSVPDTAASIERERAEKWRTLARAGKHQEAFGSIGHKPIEDLSGLLLAADAARLSGHPREAAGYLERLIARYPRSASAHVSAFTLGRLALYELREPALAARSFARAYALDRDGPLAEDALAREAEAYHRAGDEERAKRAAERYLARYPKGARRAELQRYGPGAAPARP
jgi:transmembrane sensor